MRRHRDVTRPSPDVLARSGTNVQRRRDYRLRLWGSESIARPPTREYGRTRARPIGRSMPIGAWEGATASGPWTTPRWRGPAGASTISGSDGRSRAHRGVLAAARRDLDPSAHQRTAVDRLRRIERTARDAIAHRRDVLAGCHRRTRDGEPAVRPLAATPSRRRDPSMRPWPDRAAQGSRRRRPSPEPHRTGDPRDGSRTRSWRL